jgi:hypothetical protein
MRYTGLIFDTARSLLVSLYGRRSQGLEQRGGVFDFTPKCSSVC